MTLPFIIVVQLIEQRRHSYLRRSFLPPPLSSIAFIADAMVVIDIAWTVAGSAGPNAHHLEMALASPADREGNSRWSVAPAAEKGCGKLNTTATAASANETTDIWTPYKATGLKLKISAEISPDTGDGGVASRSSARGHGETREPPATTPVSDGKTYLEDGLNVLPLEPLGRGTLGALGNSGNTSTRRPRSFPNTKGIMKEREKESDGVVNGFLRTHRHQRAESDGPPQRSFGGARSGKTAAAHGRSSGFLSDKRRRRSRTERCAPEEKETQEGAVSDEAGGGGGLHRAKESEKLSPTQKLFSMSEGSGEAIGSWAGSRVSMGEKGEGGGRVGEEGGERIEGRKGGQNEIKSISPLTLRVEDDDDLVDGLPGLARTPRVAGMRSSGPASCPPRPSGDPGDHVEGRDAFNVDHAQVRLAHVPVMPLYFGLQKSLPCAGQT